MGSLIVVLEHKESHGQEDWVDEHDGTVRVEFHYPGSIPSVGRVYMSYLQALRQFTLMTSCEGWSIRKGTEGLLHAWAEALDVDGEETSEIVMIKEDPQ